MLEDSNIHTLTGDLKLYGNVICKLILNPVCGNVKLSRTTKQLQNMQMQGLTNVSPDLPSVYDILGDSFVPHDSFVPYTEDAVTVLCPNHTTYDSSVPYKVIGKIPQQLIPVFKLLAGKYKVIRPPHLPDSRVYSNISNLKRDFRRYLLLNGKPLIGFDIANCQPLLAAIAFKRYSEDKYGYVTADVAAYLQICEEALFYEYFMGLNHINTTSEQARTDFKKLFFGKVFYTKEVEKRKLSQNTIQRKISNML